MQDRYAGDVGDFMKLGLLRVLSASEPPLRLGVNWYLTVDESHNADGKHISYLDTGNRIGRSLAVCDLELFAQLGTVVTTDRTVDALERSAALPADTLTFRERLAPGLAPPMRRQWHDRARQRLREADLVFLDPDNGLAPAASRGRPEKYASVSEVADYVDQGQSVVIYHHADRTVGGVPVQVQRRLFELAAAVRQQPLGAVVTRRGSCRFFLLIPAAAHRNGIVEALDHYLGRWTRHSEFVKFRQTDAAQPRVRPE